MLTPKKLFVFAFQTDLDENICYERLADAYEEKLRKDNVCFRHIICGSALYFFKKRYGVRMHVRKNSCNTVPYSIMLSSVCNKVHINCKINCKRGFYLSADVILIAMLVFLFSVVTATILSSADASAYYAFYGIIPLAFLLVGVFVYNEITARNIVIDYMEKALDARLVE